MRRLLFPLLVLLATAVLALEPTPEFQGPRPLADAERCYRSGTHRFKFYARLEPHGRSASVDELSLPAVTDFPRLIGVSKEPCWVRVGSGQRLALGFGEWTENVATGLRVWRNGSSWQIFSQNSGDFQELAPGTVFVQDYRPYPEVRITLRLEARAAEGGDPPHGSPLESGTHTRTGKPWRPDQLVFGFSLQPLVNEPRTL